MQVSSTPDLPELLYRSKDDSTDSDSSEEDMPERKDIRSNKSHGLSRKSRKSITKKVAKTNSCVVGAFPMPSTKTNRKATFNDDMGFSDSDTDEGEFDDPPMRQKDFSRRYSRRASRK